MSNPLSTISNNISRSSSSSIPINLPGINMEVTGNIFALCPECEREFKKLADKINKTTEKVTGYINQAYCMGMVLTDPSMLLNAVGTMAGMATAIAKNLATRMADLIKNQITQAVTTITGAINGALDNVKGYIDAVSSFLKTAENTLEALRNFKVNLSIQAKQDLDDFATQEDCEYAFAMIAACLVNKLIGDKLVKLEKDITDKINKERS